MLLHADQPFLEVARHHLETLQPMIIANSNKTLDLIIDQQPMQYFWKPEYLLHLMTSPLLIKYVTYACV